LRVAKALGTEVKACPCKTMVPLYRNHVFAQLRPTTNSRLDLGLCFTTYKGKLPSRLIDTGGLAKKDRITHRIELTSAAQTETDLKKVPPAAYDLDLYRRREFRAPCSFPFGKQKKGAPLRSASKFFVLIPTNRRLERPSIVVPNQKRRRQHRGPQSA